MRIAIDVGGVLFATQPEPPTSTHQLIDGCMDALVAMSTAGHELWILSFCGRATEVTVRAALHQYGITQWIPETHWLFVRNPKHKGASMIEHNIDLLIDDLPTNIARVTRGLLFEGDWPATLESLRRLSTE